MKDEKEYRILSVDGGGIKGLYSAKILEAFERRFSCKISDRFDMICGTSTGGIIAAALAVGIPAKDIVNFYKENGPKIFPYKQKITRGAAFMKHLVYGSKYDNKMLRQCLQEVFGDKKMKDSLVALCIPSFNLTRGTNVVFKNDHAPDLCRDNEHCMVDILLATAAAPTYFPVHSFSSMCNDSFVDGGLWANNPSLVGIIEAIRYYIKPQGDFDCFKTLSIGSIEKPFGYDPKDAKMSARSWLYKSRLIETIFSAQAENIHYTIEHLKSILPGYCYRISSPSLTSEQQKLIDLDNATKESLKELESLGKSVADREGIKPEVKLFFQEA